MAVGASRLKRGMDLGLARLARGITEKGNVSDPFGAGEVADVTGWLGGYNFQWAWSSGWVARQFV